MKRILFSAIIVAMIVANDAGHLAAVDIGGGGNPPLGKITGISGSPVATKININNISAWYSSNGEEERNPTTTNAGLDYPRGTSQSIYAAGLMFSGEFNDGNTPVIRTNGYSYNAGFQRGRIVGTRTGVTEDPDADDVRIWRVRRDFNSADLRLDAAELNAIPSANVTDGQIDAVRGQYLKDWLEWPASKGAPFYDADSDGIYTPVVVDGIPTLFPDADEPGIADGDQVVWYVANDIGGRSPWGATPPGGLELQLTVWGYARTDALGEVVFKKYRLIYKGTASTPASATISNMYLSQWSDPDVGSSTDDFAGCDTVLSLGYAYNGRATDTQYDQFPTVAAPPATGYDFLQGPIIRTGNPADSAIFNLKRIGGAINLPMTSFVYFAAGGPYNDPPFTYAGGLQWNCMLQGLPPTPQPPPCPAPPTDPYTQQPGGKYWLYGGSDGSSAPNPNSPNGWVDGQIEGPSDRRIILASGPFTMAVGDTQELVSAVVGGVGSTYLKSVEVMKFNDRSVQQAYDNLFNLPKPPPAPDLEITALDGKLVLDWESNTEAKTATEETEFQGGYKFEGYKVYQFPTAGSSLSDGILLGTFDLTEAEDVDRFGASVKTIFQETFDIESGEILNLPVQFGTDIGVVRTMVVNRDEVRSAPMVNGTQYYFGITAYNYTADPTIPLKTLESSPIVVTGVPAAPDPGTRYPYDVNDTVRTVTDIAGTNDATVDPVIFTPTRQFGETYEVRFDTLPGGTSFTWDFVQTGTNDTLALDVPLATDTSFHFVTHGFDLTVMPPLQGTKSVVDQNGDNVFGPSDIPDGAAYRILGKSTDQNSVAGGGLNTGRTYELRFGDTSFVFNRKGAFAAQSKVIRAPFSVWDLGRSDQETPQQVMGVIRDETADTSWNVKTTLFTQDETDFSVFEPIYISNIPYVADDPGTTTREDSAAVAAKGVTLFGVANSGSHVNNAVDSVFVADLNGDGVPPGAGTSVFFNKYLEVRSGDVKQVQFESVVSGDVAIARDDVTLVNVFPNPYYGLNTRETSSQARFVTFNHLPAQATIRIFNLAGVLVRTLVKDAGTANATSPQHFQWNLQNDNGLPVASGIYIVYIEMKDASGNDLGKKILKLAIIQEQQFLPYY